MTNKISLAPAASRGPSHMAVTGALVAGNAPRVMSVPRSQLYYWSAVWQDAEREALAELDAGQGNRFGDATSAIKWLLSD